MRSTDDTRQAPKAGRVQTTVTLQVDAYGVMSQAVAIGVEAGFRRANKYTATLPDADTEQGRRGIDTVTEAVLAEITQWFAFPNFGLDATDGPLERGND